MLIYGICLKIAVCVGERSAQGAELVPVVATREDATQAKNDYQEKSRPEGEAKRWPRRRFVMVKLHRVIWRTLHH